MIQKKSGIVILLPFANIRSLRIASPISAGGEKRRAFNVPFRYGSRRHNALVRNALHRCLARLYEGFGQVNRSRKIRIRYHLKHPFIGSSASHEVSCLNHYEDKNAVFHTTRACHVRFHISDKIWRPVLILGQQVWKMDFGSNPYQTVLDRGLFYPHIWKGCTKNYQRRSTPVGVSTKEPQTGDRLIF